MVREFLVKLFRCYECGLGIELADEDRCWKISNRYTEYIRDLCIKYFNEETFCTFDINNCILFHRLKGDNIVVEQSECDKLKQLHSEMIKCFNEINSLEKELIELSKKGKVKLVVGD